MRKKPKAPLWVSLLKPKHEWLLRLLCLFAKVLNSETSSIGNESKTIPVVGGKVPLFIHSYALMVSKLAVRNPIALFEIQFLNKVFEYILQMSKGLH